VACEHSVTIYPFVLTVIEPYTLVPCSPTKCRVRV